MISSTSNEYSSAPAAYGVYPGETLSYQQTEPTTYSQDMNYMNFYYDYSTSLYQQPDSTEETPMVQWMPHRGFCDDSFAEFIHDEKDADYEYSRTDPIHINPASIEGFHGYPLESGQTIANSSAASSPAPRAKKAARSTGKPTNIVATNKMDRKTLKRLRNRVSASRCRVKKKEWINDLENESAQFNEENIILMQKIASLEESIKDARNYLEFCNAKK